MLAILWLIVWATVAEAFYDDYNWYTSDDGVNSKRAFDSQRLVRGNFSDSLRSFANAYNPAREGDEELTMAKVKTRLRMLKIFKHTGSSKDFDTVNAAESSSENTEKLENAEIRRTNEHNALRFKLAPKQCNKKQEKYRIDWCNWCYCNDYYQRVCTDWNCTDHGGKPPRPERKKCIEGARYQRGKCKYCYCNIGSVMICNTRRNCNETWWFLKHGITKYQTQTTFIPSSTTRIVKRRMVARTTPSTVDATESFNDIHNIQNDEVMETINKTEFMPQKAARRFEVAPKICIRGEEKYRIDWCNWCYCNDYFQRVCTDWKCNDHGGLPPPPEKRKCIVGARYERGKCKYCYCNVGSVMICKVRLNCTEPWWYLVNGTTPYRPQTPYSYPPTTTTTHRPHKVPKHNKKSKHHHDKYLRNGEKQCIEGSSYKVDSCNYCSCLRGNEICTSKPCPNNDSEMEDVVKTSLENMDNDEILGSSHEDTKPRLFIVHDTSKWRNQILPPPNEMATLLGQVHLQPTNEESQELTTVKPNTMKISKTCYFFEHDERQCIEGCYYKIDSCNYCLCVNGKEMCTNDPCINNDLGTDPDNNMVELPQDIVNDVASSFPKTYEITENNESDDNFDLSYIDNEYENDGRRKFHPAPKICNKKERYRIDWCNYCYCNDKHERVCTDKNCTGHGSAQPPRELKKCIVGARFERSKCKYCYCGIYYHLICNTRRDCIEDQPEVIAEVQIKDTRKSLTNVLRSNMNIECDEASIVQIGDCNYCLCTDEGKWKCTDNICSPKISPSLGALRMSYQNNLDDQPEKCNIGETYRLDACNYCYCTANRERVCTTNKCKHNEKVEGRFPLSSEENDCKIGTRFRQGKCNYCYCNYDHKLICSVNRCFRRSRKSRLPHTKITIINYE